MFRFRGAVHYHDGSTEEFQAGNVGLAAWERYAHRHGYAIGQGAPPTISSLVVAHHAVGGGEPFDPWEATVEGVELYGEQEHDAESIRRAIGVAADATEAEILELVKAALSRKPEEPEIPPTRPGASTD